MGLDDPAPSDNRHLTKYVADATDDGGVVFVPASALRDGDARLWNWVAARHCDEVRAWMDGGPVGAAD